MDKKALEDRDSVVLLSWNPTADAMPALYQTLNKVFPIILQVKIFRVSAGTKKRCTTI